MQGSRTEVRSVRALLSAFYFLFFYFLFFILFFILYFSFFFFIFLGVFFCSCRDVKELDVELKVMFFVERPQTEGQDSTATVVVV